MDLATIWQGTREKLVDELGWLRTQGWLDELRLRSLEKGVATFESSCPRAREYALAHEASLRAALREILQVPVTVRLTTGRRRGKPRKPEAPSAPRYHLEAERINERFLFSAFLTGPASEIPLRFARQVVDAPGRWNPILFYGASGNGKTHLLHGIANEFRQRYPGRRVIYSSSERFARSYSATARRRQADAFRDHYRRADLLLLDDLQDLVGKQATERELVFTLDSLTTGNQQVVLATTESPKRLNYQQAGLEGRLLGGLVVPIDRPDRETRREIVRARCAAGRMELSEPVVELLLNGFGSSMRELLTALTRLDAYRRHVGTNLNLPTVRHLLADLLQDRVRPATLESLTEFVSQRLEAPGEQQRGRSRKPNIVRARQVSMALARELTPLTLREIGTFFGGRSCASVHLAQQRLVSLREEDAGVREVWETACGLFTRPS